MAKRELLPWIASFLRYLGGLFLLSMLRPDLRVLILSESIAASEGIRQLVQKSGTTTHHHHLLNFIASECVCVCAVVVQKKKRNDKAREGTLRSIYLFKMCFVCCQKLASLSHSLRS